MLQVHDLRSKSCNECNKKFVGAQQLRTHMKSHRKMMIFICTTSKLILIAYMKNLKLMKPWKLMSFLNTSAITSKIKEQILE